MTIDLVWWVTAIELPVIGTLFWLIWRTKKESEHALSRLREVVEARNAQLREALSGFKLEVAKTYASIGDLKDVEGRLVAHLLRIEAKLDSTAMKTEALHANK